MSEEKHYFNDIFDGPAVLELTLVIEMLLPVSGAINFKVFHRLKDMNKQIAFLKCLIGSLCKLKRYMSLITKLTLFIFKLENN